MAWLYGISAGDFFQLQAIVGQETEPTRGKACRQGGLAPSRRAQKRNRKIRNFHRTCMQDKFSLPAHCQGKNLIQVEMVVVCSLIPATGKAETSLPLAETRKSARPGKRSKYSLPTR